MRVDVTAAARGADLGQRVGSGLFNGSPTIAGTPSGSRRTQSAARACSASTRWRAQPLPGPSSAGPRTSRRPVVGDRLYLPTTTAACRASSSPRARARVVGTDESPSARAPQLRQRAARLGEPRGRRLASDDGGARGGWSIRAARSASRVSAQTGMISLGDRVTDCGCRQVRLWTADGGRPLARDEGGGGGGFVGGGGTLWWWRGGNLFRAATWPPAKRGCADSGSRGSRA